MLFKGFIDFFRSAFRLRLFEYLSFECKDLSEYLFFVFQSLAKLTVHFQTSLSVSDAAGEVTDSTAGDQCYPQQYCDTGCQTDIMGEVRGHTTTLMSDLYRGRLRVLIS